MFSGGRDSAVACFIAKRVADIKGWGFRLVHIDTGIALPDVKPYVEKYAKWLGAELVVLHAAIDYWVGVKRMGYPMLKIYRWCKDYLKSKPLHDYLMREYKPIDVVVMGIRKSESLFREHAYNRVFYKYKHEDGLWVNYWLPVLYADDRIINMVIRKYGIPVSPVWVKVGISGECICMAGMSKNTLIRIIRNYPEFARWLAEKDREVQRERRRGEPMRPAPLYNERKTLAEFIEEQLRSSFLDDFLTSEVPYVGKACQGDCMLG